MSRLSNILLLILMLFPFFSCSRVKDGKSTAFRGEGLEAYVDSIVRVESIFDSLYSPTIAAHGEFSVSDLALAAEFLNPEKSVGKLRSEVTDGCVRGSDFPLVADLGAWATAAWGIYCVNGSAEWLSEAYDVLTASLREQRYFASAQDSPLIGGQGAWISDPADFYPSWMTPMDRYETVATAVNVSQACAFAIASRMATELGLDGRGHSSEFSCRRSLINDRLWIPASQRYGQCLYGRYYPILSTVSDNRANVMCVLCGIATSEMAEALVSSIPVLADGIPDVYPCINPVGESFSASTQAQFALAAAKARNHQAFTHAAAALMNSPYPALWAAVIGKGIFGMSFSPEGIDFRPMVPPVFGSSRELRGLRYRNSVLDIALHGTGDRIASFMLDSVSVRHPHIPAGLEGHHRVEITLSGNDLPERGVNIVEPLLMPPPPQITWDSDGLTAKILNSDDSRRYAVYVDGVMEQQIVGDTYALRSGRPSVTAVTEILAPDMSGFSPRSHVYAPGQSEITIHASSVTPRRPPLHFIKDRHTATNYIELAARHNTRITCYANAHEPGDYFLTVGYSNGSQRCALRTLSINDTDVATIVCPSIRQNDWVTVHSSNTVIVPLVEGPNKIALTYMGGTILLNKITLLRKAD